MDTKEKTTAELVRYLARLTETQLNPPMTDRECEELSKAIRMPVPKSLEAVLRVGNGEIDQTFRYSGMIAGEVFHSSQEVAHWVGYGAEYTQEAAECRCPFLSDQSEWEKKWIAISTGYDAKIIFIDMGPSECGVVGQIVLASPVNLVHGIGVIAKSYHDMLQRTLDHYQLSGFDPEDNTICADDFPFIDPNTGKPV